MPRTFADIQLDLSNALGSFDWAAADRLAFEMAQLALRDASAIDTKQAQKQLGKLRQKRRFQSLGFLAEAMLQTGKQDAQVRRQLAQAAIDQGNFYAAEMALQANLNDPEEGAEALGLLGRLYKQLYVEANRGQKDIAPSTEGFLKKSIDYYSTAYLSDKTKNYWPGINIAAVVARGRRDGFQLKDAPDPNRLAAELLPILDECEKKAPGDVIWIQATRLECHVALGEADKAIDAAKLYAGADRIDAFEIGSTLRQMEEVWQLTDKTELGKQILPVLRAKLLQCSGGTLRLTGEEVVTQAAQAKAQLQAVHGDIGFQSLEWYEKGLACCKSIALIALRGSGGRRGFGTAWLVNAADFFANTPGQLLVTNAHVVGPSGALGADNAEAVFQIGADNFEIDNVFRESPPSKYDVSFLKLKSVPNRPSLKLAPYPARFDRQFSTRLYIIGHPYGKELSFSLQDNLMLDLPPGTPPERVHYRTPTTNGSSGSPVFNELNWEVVALHHAGSTFDETAGQQPYNEGISIQAIQRAARDGKLS